MLTRALIRIGKVFGVLVLIALALFVYINIPVKTPDEPYNVGVTFSWRHSEEELGLNWKDVYTAMLDDLGVRKIRIPVYWDHIEKVQGTYDWAYLDYEVAEAEKRHAQLILAIGRKVPRWPECFIPDWAEDDTDLWRAALLRFIPRVIDRYKDSPAVVTWQIENEPFLAYGLCPPFDVDFFDQELAVARMSDPSRPILVTDSGELSTWVPAAKRGDIFGTTMYRNVYTQKHGAYTYPIGPRFFQLKRLLIKHWAHQSNAVVIELQGEPWLAGPTISFPVKEQLANMNAARLRENVDYARQGGFREIYLWGVEWWYYMKAVQGIDDVWNGARAIYQQQELQ